MYPETAPLFGFQEFWWVYALFTVLTSIALTLSIYFGRKGPGEVSVTRAGKEALSWIVLALLCNLALYFFALSTFEGSPERLHASGLSPREGAYKIGLEFLSGYLVEKALAVDNLFVFVVIFRFFHIPAKFQHRVLFYGLFGAIALRAIFIAIGASIMRYETVTVILGLFLIFQAVQIFRGHEPDIDPEHNWFLRTIKRYLPLTPKFDEGRFFTRIGGALVGTPLLLALIVIEFTDVIFAMDSVPAVFGLTREPLVVFTSNVLAVIDLRVLYFLLAAFIDKFHYLNHGLSLVLLFIGSKMVWLDRYFGHRFPTELSLGIVGVLIVGSILLSLTRRSQKA